MKLLTICAEVMTVLVAWRGMAWVRMCVSFFVYLDEASNTA